MYKIVKLKDGKNVPIYANPQCEVEYIEGEQTVRNEFLGPFTAIDTLVNAIAILNEQRKTIVNMTNLRLHECTGDLSTETDAWYINGTKTVITPISELPVGTVLLDTITLGIQIVVLDWVQERKHMKIEEKIEKAISNACDFVDSIAKSPTETGMALQSQTNAMYAMSETIKFLTDAYIGILKFRYNSGGEIAR